MMYLKDGNKIFDNIPITIMKFVLLQPQCFVGGDLINSMSVFEYKNHHIVGGVLLHYNIMWDKLHFEAEFKADPTPGRQNDCS